MSLLLESSLKAVVVQLSLLLLPQFSPHPVHLNDWTFGFSSGVGHETTSRYVQPSAVLMLLLESKMVSSESLGRVTERYWVPDNRAYVYPPRTTRRNTWA